MKPGFAVQKPGTHPKLPVRLEPPRSSLRGAVPREAPPAGEAPAAPRERHAPIPKGTPERSRSYLAFVRAKPCAWCSAPAPSDPHHQGRHGMGSKTDDWRCIPLCRADHDQYGRTRTIGTMDAALTASWAAEQIICLLIEWNVTRSER